MKKFTLFCLFLAIIMMPKTMSAQSLLYSENFDASSSLPSGWTHPSSGSLTMETDHARTGNCLKFSGANPNVAVMPALGVEISAVELTFWERPEGSSSGDFDLGYVTDPNDANSFVQVMTWNNSKGLTYEEHANISFAGAPAGARIAFRQRPTSTSWFWFVDDIEVYQTLPCNGPTGLYISDLTTTSATLNWGMTTDGSDYPTYFQVEVKDENGATVYSNNQVSGTAYQLPLTGLTANTTYSVRMRGDCDVTYSGFSAWTSFSFTTACELTDLPYVQNFDGLNGVPDCTTSLNASINSSTKYGSTGKSLQLSTTAGASAYMVFPLVNGIANNLQFTAMLKSSLTSGSLTYMIGIVADAADIEGTFEPLLVDSLVDSDWHDIGMNTALASVATNGTSICVFVGSGKSASLYIDDVAIRPIPTCTRPEQFRGYDVTASTYTLTWSTTNATTCRVEIVNLDNSTTTYQTATTNPYTVTGLAPQTNYKFRIWGVCSATDSSQMTSYIQTKTLCSVLTNPAFFQGAEGTTGSNLPDCWTYGFWTRTGSTTYDQPFQTQSSSTYVHSGSRSFQLRDMSSGNISYLASPGMVITTPNEYEVSIWMYRPSGTSNPGEGLHFWLSNSADNVDAGSNAVDLGFYNRYAGNAPIESGSGWFNYVFPISLTGDVYFIIEGDSKYGSSTYFDDIEVRLAPSCFKPGDTDMAFTDSTVTVFWQPSVSAPASYAVAYTLKQGTTTIATDSVEVTGTIYTIPGLTANTSYTLTARIYAVCSATDISEAKVFSRSFKTPCVSQTAPYTEDFEGMSTNIVPDCWDNSASTSQEISSSPHYIWGVYSYGGNNMIRMYNYLVHNGLAMITTPVINLAAGSPYELSFDYSNKANCGDLTVSVTTDGGLTYTDLGAYPSTGSSSTDPGTFTTQIISLNQFAGNDIMIKFSTNANYGNGALFIDNVSVNMASTCPRLTGTIGNVTDTTANILIPEDCAWQISYGPEGTAADDGTIIDIASGTAGTITGLVGMTSYVAYVRTVCDTVYGVWSKAIPFRTACASNVFPYSTSFEGMTVSAVPECWDLAGTTATASTASYIWSVYNYNNNNSVRLYNALVQAGQACLVSPSVRLAAGGSYMLAFSHAHNANCGAMEVQVTTDGGANYTTVFTVPASGQISSTNPGTLSSEEVDLSAFAGNDINIRFIATTTYSQGAIFIDDVSIDVLSGCMKLNGTAQNVQDITADIVIADSCAWELSYGPAGTAAGGGTVVAVPAGTTSYTLTGLSGQTNYVAYVRRVCDTTYGVWSNAISFKTTVTPTYAPFATGFEDDADNMKWEFVNSTGGNDWTIGTDADAVSTGSKALYVSDDGSAYGYNTGNSSKSFAYRTISFDAANYTLSFRWKCTGGESGYDFGNVLIIPVSEAITGGSGSSYSAITYPNFLYNITPSDDKNFFSLTQGEDADGWNTFTGVLDMTAHPGVYNLAFMWNNDYSSGTDYPFAIDNLRISQITCNAPAVVASGTSADTTTIQCGSSDATQWEVVVSTTPIDVFGEVTGDIYQGITSGPVGIGGLSPNTAYYYTARAICQPGDTSDWAAAQTVRTACMAYGAPYTETFEDMGALNCWTSFGNVEPSRNTSYHYAGMASMKVTDGAAISPEFNIPSMETYMVNGFAYSTADSTMFSIGVMVDPEDGGTFEVLGQEMIAIHGQWQEFTAYFTLLGDEDYEDFASAKHFALVVGGDATVYFDNVVFGETPECPKPTEVVTSNVLAHSFDLSWTDNAGATTWIVKAVPTVGSTVTQTVTTNPATITGLNAQTQYSVSIAAICSTSDTSYEASCGTIKTACDVINLPYQETFETMEASTVPDCWDNSMSTTTTIGTNPSYVWGVYSYNDNQMLRMYNYYVQRGGTAIINFPLIALPADLGSELTFDYAHNASCGAFDLQISTDAGATFTTLQSFYKGSGTSYTNPGTWIPASVNLTSYAGQTVMLRFNSNPDYDQGAIFIDNILIKQLRACSDLTAAAALNITDNSADVVFTDTCTTHTQWQYAYGPAGFDLESAALTTVTTDTISLTSLTASTMYTLYVRAYCDATEQSNWYSVPFKTLSEPAPLPYVCGFDDATELAAWDIQASGPNTFVFGNTASALSAGSTNALYVSSNGSSHTYATGTASATAASRLFYFPAGRYVVMFDWLCSGGESQWDYSRFYFVPAATGVQLPATGSYSASYYPSDMIPLDGGTYHNLTNGWQHVDEIIDFTNNPGGYYLVYTWSNDGSGGTANYPLAINNIVIADEATFCRPIEGGVTVLGSSATTMTVSAQMQSAHTAIVFAYGPSATTNSVADTVGSVTSATGSAVLTGLTPGTQYNVYAMGICNSGDSTVWTSAATGTTKTDDCFEPENVRFVGAPTDVAATITWVGAPDVTSYEWALISGGATVMTDVTTSDTVALTGLTSATNYTFQVRGFCGTTDTTNWVTLTFATTKSLAVLPYMCDFETTSENNQWDIYNGSQTNKLIIGAATGNGGSSMYVSNNNSSYAYNTSNTSNVCATRMFQLPAGQYSYSYDWQCYGESTYDYGRVFLVPDGAVAPVAGTQVASYQTDVTSAGGYNLDKENGSSYYKLNLGTGWTNVTGTFTVPTTGNYILVVQWHNDSGDGVTPPLAIDNFQLAALTCPQPTATVTAGETTATANIVFNTESDSIIYAVSTGSYTDAFFADTVSGQNTINITGLTGSSSYNLFIKVICGAGDESMLVTVPFRTTCGVTPLPYSQGFEDLPSSYTQHMINALCWDDLGASASSGTYPYYVGSTSSAYVSEGSKSLYMISSSSQNMYFIMPDFGTVANAHIAYDSRVENVNSSGTVQVGYMTNPAQASTFVSVYSTPKTQSMASYSVDVANLPAGARIAFAYVNASSNNYYASIDNIRVSQLVSGDTYYDTICHNTPFVNFGFNIPANQMSDGNNTFTRTKSGVTGAPDTVITANVFMLPELNTITYDTACAGVPYANGMFNIPNPSTRSYFRTFTSALGCDSTVTLYLTVEDTYEDRFDTICEGDVYTFEGQQITAAGDYTAYTTTSHGCTDTVVLHLNVVATRDTVVETICQGTSYVWHGMTYSTSGTYMWTGPGQHGCTQVSTLILTVLNDSSSRNVTICNGGSYQFRDTLITTPGTYSRTYYDVTIGCTVTETIVVTMDDLISADVYDVACQDHPYYGYGVNGVTITKDTVISIASKTAALCDSITNVHLTFIATKYGDAYAHIAEGETYEWYDNTYSVAGEYHETFQSAEGCDSVVTLHLAVGDALDNVNGVHVDVVPNPVRPGMTAYVYGEFGDVETVEILNNFGQLVDRFAPASYPIEVQGLEVEGLYYVRVITRKGEIYTEKLLVK